MPKNSLKKLTIQYLRGCVQPFNLEFEAKKLTVIYGENGTGKSTICDAFEFIGKGKVGSIDGRGLNKTLPYWASLGKKPQDISVALESSADLCRAHMGKSAVIVSPNASNPRVEILRRSQILSLIEAVPGERYKVISRFIDVSSIEESEQTLIKLIKDLKTGQRETIARIDENRETIKNFYSEAGVTDNSPLEWAEKEVTRDHSIFEKELRAIGEIKSKYNYLAQQLERIAFVNQELVAAEKSYEVAKEQHFKVIQNTFHGDDEILGLLKAAKHFFEGHTDSLACPLCESAENANGLAQRTTEKINQLAALDTATKQKDSEKRKLEATKEKLHILSAEIQSAAHQLENACNGDHVPGELSLPELPIPSDADRVAISIKQTEHLPEQWVKLEAQKQDAQKFIATLKKSVKNYQENLQQQQELEKLIPNLEKAQKIIEEERKKFTDEILAKIANKTSELYERIHPGEGLNKISLQLAPKQRASLDINTEFNGSSGVPPQAYFSESHLDTLGLCVFLALASMDSPDETILVLDDVLASIDEPHVARLISLIHDEAQHFRHCIITTHYRPWKYKLRWGWVENGQCQFVELKRWCPIKGLSSTRDVPEIQRLKNLLEEGEPDLQAVCGKAGVILEAILDFLTQLYECRVPRRFDNRYTLGDLLPNLDKKLKQALRVEILEKEKDEEGNPKYKTFHLKDALEKLNTISQTRNVVGAHFNQLSFEMLDSDALDFGKTVLELAEILLDPDKGWPRSDKSGSYWATAGETRRLHPLKMPT